METAIAQFPECPTCRTPITIDLSQDALEQDTTGRQGILARIDPSKMQTSTKIEALCVLLCPLGSRRPMLTNIAVLRSSAS